MLDRQCAAATDLGVTHAPARHRLRYHRSALSDRGSRSRARPVIIRPTVRLPWHRSTCGIRRSALPTIADYAVDMRKPIRRDGNRKSKLGIDVHNEVADTALPPKKPPVPSAKRRLRRARVRKLK